MAREIKCVYSEGSDIRALRGQLAAEDDDFITISRRSGRSRIAKRCIIKIEDVYD